MGLCGTRDSHTKGESINWHRLSGKLLDEPDILCKALAKGGKYKITSKQRIKVLNNKVK